MRTISKMKIAFILGTRPEIIKLSCLIQECIKGKNKFVLIHTNQHYSENMDKIFFSELELPNPQFNLKIGSSSQISQIATMMCAIEKVLIIEKPDVVVVQGDTNTVLAGALVASRLNIKVAHVEAGLRSYDRFMPEEENRLITDHVADFLFCPTKKQKSILYKEGIPSKNIYVTGNTIVDAVLKYAKIAKNKSSILKRYNLSPNEYFLLTCHRPSNTDNLDNFKEILKGVSVVAQQEEVQCIFPVHPRNNDKLDLIKSYKNIIAIEPIGYLDMLQLQRNSKMIFTDSGGIQEEACILKKKCVILRTNTERPETLAVRGAKLLNKIDSGEIVDTYNLLLKRTVHWKNPFGDGRASNRIIKLLSRP
jgi:UDP-N-acetylglucosamine 2-epimerase (non-hydrolysing)